MIGPQSHFCFLARAAKEQPSDFVLPSSCLARRSARVEDPGRKFGLLKSDHPASNGLSYIHLRTAHPFICSRACQTTPLVRTESYVDSAGSTPGLNMLAASLVNMTWSDDTFFVSDRHSEVNIARNFPKLKK